MSEMIASISILCFNKAEVTQKCLEFLERTLPPHGVEVILTNNGSMDHTEHVIYSSKLPNKTYLAYGVNLGFPQGHNEALKVAKGKYFICLNNDMFLKEEDWVFKLIKPLEEDSKIAIVGIDGLPCTLTDNGEGRVGPRQDYTEASCLAGRTDLFRQYGLFSPAYEMFFYEDSDLSLKYRQAGYRVAYIPLMFEHIRGQTVSLIDPNEKRRFIEKNKKVFFNKWGRYLSIKTFTGNILIRMLSHGGGDIIACTPLLSELRKEHPKSTIELETNWPDIFVENPNVDKIFLPRQSYTSSFDRVINVDLNYASYDLIIDEAQKVSFLKVENKTPQIYLSNLEIEDGADIISQVRTSDKDYVVVCSLQMARSSWNGRNWRLDYAKELIKKLNDSGFRTVEIGKGVQPTGLAHLNLVDKTTLREMFSVIANSDLFIGIDSMPFHVAQAFKVPSYILFGATEPISRIVDFSRTFAIRNDNLKCLGCYQRKGKSDYNKCIIGTEECMMGLTPERAFSFVNGEINPGEYNMNYLQEFARRQK